MRVTFWTALKDWQLAARDKKGLLMLLVMPLILITILGNAFGNTFSNEPKIAVFPVGIVDEDHGEMAQALREVLNSTEIKKIIQPTDLSPSEAHSRIEQGKLSTAILIPPHFSKDIMSGSPAALQLLTDQADSLHPMIVQSICNAFTDRVTASQIAVQEIMAHGTKRELNPEQLGMAIAAQLEQNPPKAIEQSSSAQAPPSAMQYYAAAMGVMFLLFSGLTGIQSIISEREQQTWPRFLAAPSSNFYFLAGKFFGVVFIALSQFTILAVGTTVVFHVYWGNPLSVFVIILCYALAVGGLALALAVWIKNSNAVIGFWSIAVQIMSALGGSMFPLALFPPGMKLAAHFSPNYWGLQALVQTMQNGPFPWQSAAVLLGLCLCGLILGSMKKSLV